MALRHYWKHEILPLSLKMTKAKMKTKFLLIAGTLKRCLRLNKKHKILTGGFYEKHY